MLPDNLDNQNKIMINAIEWFKEKGFTFDDKITIMDVIDLQTDALECASKKVDEHAEKYHFAVRDPLVQLAAEIRLLGYIKPPKTSDSFWCIHCRAWHQPSEPLPD